MIVDSYVNKDGREISKIAFFIVSKVFIALEIMQINKLHHTKGEKAIQILCLVLIKDV